MIGEECRGAVSTLKYTPPPYTTLIYGPLPQYSTHAPIKAGMSPEQSPQFPKYNQSWCSLQDPAVLWFI